MFRNYLIVAVRHLLRQKLYAFINVFGLAVALACCILIFLYVRHEWQFDAFHENADRIFRVVVRETRPDGSIGFSTLHPVSIAASLKEEFPGIVRASGFIRSHTQVSYQKRFLPERFGMVEPDFLKMFSFQLLVGNPATALQRLDGAVISETVAFKLFGNPDGGYAEALGKPVMLGSKPFAVTGVMRDVPETSSLKFGLLIPIEYHNNYPINRDGTGGTASIYVQLLDAQESESLEAAFPPFAGKHLGDRIGLLKEHGRVGHTEDGVRLRLQPLRDVYLNADVRGNSYEAAGNVVYSYVLSGLALLVLAIAGINYMTLAAGRSAGRAREVGMRKAMGAHRAQLMGQFWGEALLLSLIALAMAVALAEMFLPVFSGLARKNLSIPYLDGWGTALVLSGMVFIVGLAAGSYPALVLPGLQTVDVLKGQLRIGGRYAGSRALVVGQYAMSISLMIGAAMMFRQLNYVRDKDLGYREEQVVIVRGMVSNADAVCARYKAEIAKSPGVVSATISDRAFTTGYNVVPMEKVNGDRLNVRVIQIDRDYLETLDIRLVAGRNIPPASSSDSTSYALANEKLAGMLDWGETVGKTLRNPAWRNLGEPTIIGVVGDFHFDSMRKEIQPLLLHDGPRAFGPFVLIRIRPEGIAGTIAYLQKTWEAVASDEPFYYSFLEDNLARQYRSEDRWFRITGYTFLFAILISCLGLLGLASLSVTRRTREVGIRKALGSSVSRLVLQLSGEFAKLVLVANLLAWPVAYYIMNGWLQNFAYRIDPEPGIFILCGVLALGTAMLAVGAQAVKAAMANPVDALRYE